MKLKKFNDIIEETIQLVTNKEIENNPEEYCWDTTTVPYGDTNVKYFEEITDESEARARKVACERYMDVILDCVKDELSLYIPYAIEDEGFIIDLEKVIERRV